MVKSQKTVVVCFCAVAILFVIAVVLSTCGLCGNDVSDNGSGIDDVRTELSDVRETLEEQGRILQQAEEAVRDSRKATDELARIEQDDAKLISECRGIIESVRKRASAQEGD